MRKSLVAVAVCMVVAGAGQMAYGACGAPVGMFHGLDSYINCADGGPVTAYAWQVSAPTTTNTGTLNISCEAANETPNCLSPNSGIAGDNRVTIETDWGAPGVAGCPIANFGTPTAAPQRVAISLQCSDGTGVILSLSGALPDFGYVVELAHGTDGSAVFPLDAASDNARPKVVSQSVLNNTLTANLHFNPVRVACDCDPASVGALFGACTDSFQCTGSAGTVHTRIGPCNTMPADSRTSAWTSTGITPDAAGNAIIQVPLPTDGNCLYIGAPPVVGGTPGNGIAGFIQAAGTLAASDQALEVRSARAQGKVTVSFRTASELEAVSFDIVAGGRVIGSLAAKGGNGVGASYETSLKMGDFRGEKSFTVRTNLRNGGSKTSDPVSF